MSDNLSAPSDPQHSPISYERLAIAGTALALVLLMIGVTWMAAHPPQQVNVAGPDQPCGYYWSPGEPYPYLDESGTQPAEPTSISAFATQYVEGYPGNPAMVYDFDANATAYALYAPKANAHATRCAGLNTEERETERALLYKYVATQFRPATQAADVVPTATGTSTQTMTPASAYPVTGGRPSEAIVEGIVSATPFQTFTFIPTITSTPSATPNPESSMPTPALRSDPVAAGLGYSYGGRFWRIGSDGLHGGSFLLTDTTSGLDPTLQYELYLKDQDLWLHELSSGEVRNLTGSPGLWEPAFAWWPARPGTVAYAFYDLATPSDPSSLMVYLGTINLDGSDARRLGILGEYFVQSYSLGSDGDSIAFFDELTLVRYRLSDGSRQTFALDSLGLDPACDSAFSPGFSPDMRQIATRCTFRIANTFDAATLVIDLEAGQGRVLDRHAVPDIGRERTTTPVVWSPDGRYLITANETEYGTPYRVIQATDGALVTELPGQPEVFSPDGQWLVLRATTLDAPAPWFLVDTATWSDLRPLAIQESASQLIWP